MVGGGDDQDPHPLVLPGASEVLEHLLQHLGVDRVAGPRALEAQTAHALLVDPVASSASRSWLSRILAVGLARPRSAATSRSASAAARSISAATSSRGSRKRPSTWAETISGSVESGRPTPARTRQKSRPPRPRLRLFSPLWPATPPPSLTRTSPKGRSISSWRTTTRSSGTLQRAPRRAGRGAGLVHEGLGEQHRHPRAAGADRAPRRSARRTACAPSAGPSASESSSAISKPMLWRVPA